jgi:hypothetical protein
MINTLLARRLTLGAALAVALSSPAVPARAQDSAKRSVVVHGHWTIEVLDPDGALVSRREFDNALLTNGSPILASILARRYRVGQWSVNLSGPPGEGPCEPGPSGLSTCFFLEPGILENSASDFYTLTVSSPQAGPNAGRVVLTAHGIATSAAANSRITSVTTNQFTCRVEYPMQCLFTEGAARGEFTGTSIPPISVVTGQIIQVTVVLSFQ